MVKKFQTIVKSSPWFLNANKYLVFQELVVRPQLERFVVAARHDHLVVGGDVSAHDEPRVPLQCFQRGVGRRHPHLGRVVVRSRQQEVAARFCK